VRPWRVGTKTVAEEFCRELCLSIRFLGETGGELDPDPHDGAGFHVGGVDGGVKDSRIPGTLRLVSEAHRSLGRTAGAGHSPTPRLNLSCFGH